MEGSIQTTNKRELVTAIMEQVGRGDRQHALQLYTALIEQDLQPAADPEDAICLLFGKALIQRLDPQLAQESNLYLKPYQIPQIALFNLLATRLPFASRASRIANDLLLHFMDRADPVTLIDIGIGTGRQVLDLLDQLHAAACAPRLTVYGIEPNRDSLALAQRQIEERSRQHGLDVAFIPIAAVAEELADTGWHPPAGGPVVVNAAFALHHIREKPEVPDRRDAVLRMLRSLDPVGVVLCEPDSNHHQVGLTERFHQCWRHYGTLFACIDGLPITDGEKLSLKSFFGREIEDILGLADDQRCERHESTPIWLARLARTGFAPYPGFTREYEGESGVAIRRERGYYGLESGGVNVSSVIHVVPD